MGEFRCTINAERALKILCDDFEAVFLELLARGAKPQEVHPPPHDTETHCSSTAHSFKQV